MYLTGALPWTPRSVVEYPKPILQLLGEMDGYIRFTGGALEYGEVEKLMGKKGFEVRAHNAPCVCVTLFDLIVPHPSVVYLCLAKGG